MFRFSINQWAAWAPGIDTPDAWRKWAQSPFIPAQTGLPALLEVSAMARRRLDRLGRMALQAAFQARGVAPVCPVVAGSRHGSATRAAKLIQALVNDGSVSPTQFSLSVHNAIAGIFSVTRGDVSNYACIAAGRETPEATLAEACAMLADGAEEVLVMLYEEPLPPVWSEFADQHEGAFAFAWRIAPARSGHFSLERRAPTASDSACSNRLPRGLDALQFVLSDTPSMTVSDDAFCWEWRRVG